VETRLKLISKLRKVRNGVGQLGSSGATQKCQEKSEAIWKGDVPSSSQINEFTAACDSFTVLIVPGFMLRVMIWLKYETCFQNKL
jgi:hypothetical protein